MLPARMESATIATTDLPPIAATNAQGSVPWYGWVAVCGVACLPVGLLWDISWHSTIGRDTFWTPAHIVIQLGGLVPAFLFAWLALKTTLAGTDEERAAAVGIFGMRAPLGAWVTMWGAAMMVTSAPFDDWWHNTYGLDVQIISPPHSVLGTGMLAVTVGVLLFVYSWQKRFVGHQERTAALVCALAAGVMVTLYSDFMTEETFPNQQHSGGFYMISAWVFPVMLVMTARASQLRWPATIAAGVYMGVLMLMVWILPLFPAHPKLAPIYNPVDHMVPPSFPLLLVLPALGIDLVMQRAKRRIAGNDWLLALGLAAVFLAIFIPVQWFFSAFLLSDGADNWVFARSGHWPYFAQPSEWLNRFWTRRGVPFTGGSLAAAIVIAVISSRLGLWCGGYLQRVRR